MLRTLFTPVSAERKRQLRRLRKHQAGMTLLEIMVVIILVGLIGTVVGVAVIRQFTKGKVGIAKTQVCKLVQAVNQYNIEKNKFPSQSEGLEALKSAGIMKKVPKDPWSRPYVYKFPGQDDPSRPDIYSYGADGKEGGTSDTDKDIRCETDD
jgi:general secretion pathway protein G